MNAGKLRHRVTVQSPPDPADPAQQDDEGQPTQAWADLATRWASVEPRGSSEAFQAGQVTATATHMVRMRHLDGLTSFCRLKFGSRYLYVQSVANVEERDWELELVCEERLN